MERRKATLLLGNGSRFEGWSFGADRPASGEVVFSTSMVGYPESLTDPSFEGQILCVSYPLVGNYGIPDMGIGPDGLALHAESGRIHVQGLVIADYSVNYSHWDAVKSLGAWLREQGVPGISGIDTRALTRLLREEGSMPGRILIEEDGRDDPLCHSDEVGDRGRNLLVPAVSCPEVLHYGKGPKRVVLVDCGVKHNILRCLISREVEVVRVPWNYDFTEMDYDGLFLSNGPGDPSVCTATIEHIRKALCGDRPIFGVCLGSQLMALAAGAKTFKLPYGHRSHNQPVRLCGTPRCFITSRTTGMPWTRKPFPRGGSPFLST